MLYDNNQTTVHFITFGEHLRRTKSEEHLTVITFTTITNDEFKHF